MYSKCDQQINFYNLKCSKMNKSPCIISSQKIECYYKFLQDKNEFFD